MIMSETMEIGARFDASHTNYDEVDLAIIRNAAPQYQIREDATSVLFARALDYVKARTYARRYQDLIGNVLVPTSTDVPETAQTITTRYYDEVGIAKIVANYADDLPRADVLAKEATVKVHTVGNSYGYSILELRATQAAGEGIDTRRAAAARRAHEQKINRIILLGDTQYGLFGILTNPNISLVTPITGNWAAGATTATQIVADLNAMYNAVVTQSKGLHTPNFLGLPPAQLAAASTKMLEGAPGQTAMSFWRSQHPGIQVVEVPDFAGAGPGATNVALLYERNEDNLWHDLVMPFQQLPPEARNLAFVVNCISRTAGVTIQFPLAFARMNGI